MNFKTIILSLIFILGISSNASSQLALQLIADSDYGNVAKDFTINKRLLLEPDNIIVDVDGGVSFFGTAISGVFRIIDQDPVCVSNPTNKNCNFAAVFIKKTVDGGNIVDPDGQITINEGQFRLLREDSNTLCNPTNIPAKGRCKSFRPKAVGISFQVQSRMTFKPGVVPSTTPYTGSYEICACYDDDRDGFCDTAGECT